MMLGRSGELGLHSQRWPEGRPLELVGRFALAGTFTTSRTIVIADGPRPLWPGVLRREGRMSSTGDTYRPTRLPGRHGPGRPPEPHAYSRYGRRASANA